MKTYNPRYVSVLREEGRAEGLSEGRAEGLSEGRAEGRAQGQGEALLVVLEGRGVAVSDKARERVHECVDPDVLRGWLLRAVTALTEEDVFG
ncbi:hypothetical protein [Actinomadura oligospora]|uniref:hypothetical protein n=1 Tax=Actinomadura oligospora TaxID=111804 RepID=UPI00047C6B3F|nr:hypothetical protein [Actinomadura oligospora]